MRGIWFGPEPEHRWMVVGPPEAVEARMQELIAAHPGLAPVIVDDISARPDLFPPAPPRPAAPPTARDQALAEIKALDPKKVGLADLPGIVERLQKVL